MRLARVGRRFGDVRALEGIDCVIAGAQLVALAGANGSGKSTLLRILAGVIAPDAGDVEVFGHAPRTSDAAFRASTGYAGQELALDGEITGRETLRLFYALRGLPRRERETRLAAIVEEFELGSFYERRVGGYSGGQRQRLHLALETMHAPALLLLDEPTASLDPAGRTSLWRRLAAWRDRGHTVVIITHDLSDVEAHCDRVLVMRSGHLVADDAPRRLVADHGRARTTIELATTPTDRDALVQALQGAVGEGRVELHGTVVTITRERAVDGPEPALDLLRARAIVPSRFEQHRPDLASAFFALTGSAIGAPTRSRRFAGGAAGGGASAGGEQGGRGDGGRGHGGAGRGTR